MGIGLFFISSLIVNASNEFILEEDPNGLTYKIEREDKTVRLHMMLVLDKETRELVYCLEPGVNLSQDAYEELEEWEYAKLNLTEEQKDYITKVAYFGYGYQNQRDLNYYYAAQLLIWEKIIPQNWNIYYTNTLGGDKVEWFQEEKETIKFNINEAEKLPSFANQTLIWNGKDTLKIIDSNKVLENYHTNSNFVEMKGNTLKITQAKQEEIKFIKEYSGSEIKFYVKNDGQNVLRKGKIPHQEFTIKLNPYKTKIEIEKINESNKPIANVVFLLKAKEDILNQSGTIIYKKGDTIEKCTTNEEGKIVLNDLYDGNYILKEIEAPKEYQVETREIPITINQNHQIHYEQIINQKKRQKLLLKKEDQDTKIALANVRFQIWNNQECIFDGYTNDHGEILLDKLLIGTYKIIEIETLEDYELPHEPLMIELNGEEEIKTIIISNRKIKKVPNTIEQKIPSIIIYEEKRKRK